MTQQFSWVVETVTLNTCEQSPSQSSLKASQPEPKLLSGDKSPGAPPTPHKNKVAFFVVYYLTTQRPLSLQSQQSVQGFSLRTKNG